MDQTVGGLHVQYFSVCKRKLWLYSKQIGFETEHEKVIEGTVLRENSYKRKKKEYNISNYAVVDVVDQEYIQETKLSSKMQKADELQLLYYLYLLKLRGIDKKGRIAYTKEKKVIDVELTEEKEKEIKRILAEIHTILEEPFAPKLKKKPYCKSCAYYDFCYALEEE